MALKPEATEIIRGIQRSLMTHVLPELSSQYAGAQVQYAVLLLNALASEWDGAAQRLVEDNASLRALCGEAAARLQADDAQLVAALESAAAEHDPDILLTTLSAANDRLRGLVTRVIGAAGESAPRSDILDMCTRVLSDGAHRRAHGAI